MHIENLNIEEFNIFQKNHPLSNYYQTVNYGMLKAENGYDYEIIGLKDDSNQLLAASLILLKKIGTQSYYGYAPRGFLIDYNNNFLLNTFIEEIKNYYAEKKVVFIKINPNIPIGIVNNKTYEITYNENLKIKDYLIQNNFRKLADNLYFEAQLPRFNAFINLKKFNTNDLNKNTRNKIRKGIRKGLVFEHAEKEKIPLFCELLNNKNYYYQDYYTVFDKNNAVDLFLVSIDYDKFLQNSQYIYDIESNRNSFLNEKLVRYNTEKNINAKMASDKILLTYKNDILEASQGINNIEKKYIAGALVVKHNNTVTIIMSAYDKNYKRFVPNYFLYHNIIEYYKDKAEYFNLDGVVGDFKNKNLYTGLNRFKIGFNPIILEFIGEYDLVINQKMYDILLHNGLLKKEFDKKS